MKLIYFVFATFATISPAFSASVVSRGIVDGRTIEILNDKTWRYEISAEKTSDCAFLNSDLTFCGNSQKWRSITPPSSDIIAQYQYDAKHFGQFVIESVGSDDGMNFEFMKNAALQNAANVSSDGDVKKIIVVDILDARIGKFHAKTIVYRAKINGLPLVFSNSVSVSKTTTLQAITFAIGTNYTDMHKKLHKRFLEATKITVAE